MFHQNFSDNQQSFEDENHKQMHRVQIVQVHKSIHSKTMNKQINELLF